VADAGLGSPWGVWGAISSSLWISDYRKADPGDVINGLTDMFETNHTPYFVYPALAGLVLSAAATTLAAARLARLSRRPNASTNSIRPAGWCLFLAVLTLCCAHLP